MGLENDTETTGRFVKMNLEFDQIRFLRAGGVPAMKMLVQKSTLFDWLRTTQIEPIRLKKWKEGSLLSLQPGPLHYSEGFAEIKIPEQLLHCSTEPEFPNYRFVLELNKVNIIQPHALMVTPDLWALIESEFRRELLDEYLEPVNHSQLPIEVLPGRSASLLSNGWWFYFHWMFHHLPRLRLLQLAEVPYDRLLVNCMTMPFQSETLARAGVDLERVQPCQDDISYHCDTLYFPSFCNPASDVDPHVVRWLQSLFRPKLRAQRDRLYISRGQTDKRRLVNETELLPLLERYGFEVLQFEEMTVQEQIDRIGNAAVIMGPTGGGFTNLIYAREDVQLVEIHHTYFTYGFFGFLAEMLNLSYRPIAGETVPNDNFSSPWSSDIYLDPETLERYLKELP